MHDRPGVLVKTQQRPTLKSNLDNIQKHFFFQRLATTNTDINRFSKRSQFFQVLDEGIISVWTEIVPDEDDIWGASCRNGAAVIYRALVLMLLCSGTHCDFMLHLEACRGDTLITMDAREKEKGKPNLINRRHTSSFQEQMLRGSETL